MIRLVMDFYLHTAKGQPSTSFPSHDDASYPIAPRYSQSSFAVDVNVDCKFCEGYEIVFQHTLLVYYTY